MEILPSKLAQAILQLKGKPLNLTEYKPFELIYDLAPHTLVAMCGRQLGKSVSLGSSIITNSILRPHFSTLFVSPLAQQTSRFSSQYLGPFCNSPIVRSHYISSTDTKNVFSKTFNTGSSITLGYAETEIDADRIRGVAADALYYDEVQDASKDALPVLEETLSASEYEFRRFTGTAKGESNTLTALFNSTNMMEWIVKCPHCSKYSIPNDFETCLKILKGNPLGPACAYCAGLLDMKTGRWMAGRTDKDVKGRIGVHIPQFAIPARGTPTKWPSLVSKADRYDHIRLSNEVFGLPVGSGGRPLSMKEVAACCNPTITKFETGFPMDSRNIIRTVLGVDWSTTNSVKSYTVVTILGFDFTGKAYILYVKRMDGMDILAQTKQVIDLFYQFKCTHIASDRGVGVVQGQMMQEALGTERVSMVCYVTAKTNLRFDMKNNFFAADRTSAIDTCVIKIKMGIGRLESPCWELMATYWQDCLNVYDEESNSGRKLYRKDDDGTDDFLHSLTFALVGDMIVKGEFVYQDKEAVAHSVFTFPD